jgi:predicted transcriptional regulator
VPKPALEKLTRREREIVNALFAAGEWASAEAVRERLTGSPSYSTVRAMLAKLEAKGYVRHREEGLRYVYAPTTSRTAARRAALQQLVHVFFSGSAEQAVTALLQQEAWSETELDALRAEIEQVRKEARRS